MDTEAKTTGGNAIVLGNTASNALAYDISSPENVSLLEDSDVVPNQITTGYAADKTGK